MAYEYYTLQLGKNYVLSLFQGALDDIIEKHRPDLNCWADCIMDWYEDQLEYDELDWEIESIPELVWSDIVQSKLQCIGKNSKFYDSVEKIYERDGIGRVESNIDNGTDEDFLFTRICFVAKDNDGDNVYIVQEEE